MMVSTKEPAPTETGLRRYRRSPFYLLYWDAEGLVALNCNRYRMFKGAERYLNLLVALGQWATADDLAQRLMATTPATQRALDRLVRMELVVEHPPGPGDDLSSGDQRTDWNLVELALQRQTAAGGFDPAQLQGEAPAAFKPRPASTPIVLPAAPLSEEVSLRSALENRRSQRRYADTPLSIDQLGTFLASSARVTGTRRDPVVGEISRRPYPSGGGRHPLEIYVVCNSVAGLAPGAYQYHPLHHELYPLNASAEGLATLNSEVRMAAGNLPRRDPPVVLMITAVFQRSMWKYQRLALSLILKEVGALYQGMHLVATAMGLAGCPLGGGRESDNAQWLGLDSLHESQVGCFLLGWPENEADTSTDKLTSPISLTTRNGSPPTAPGDEIS